MPKSKTDKSRKQKLLNFKKSKKMSKAPEMKPFRQVPTWQSTEEFTMNGAQLESLYNYFNIFAPAYTTVQQVFAKGIKEGKIKIGYEYEDGTPISEEEVEAYTKKINEYFKAKQTEEDTGQSEEPKAGKIVSMTGEPLTAE